MSRLRDLAQKLVGDNANEIHADLTGYLKQIRKGGVKMSKVNKPTIPAEVADAIEAMRKIPYCNNRDITNAYDGDPGRRELRSIPFDTLLAALVNGYEREKPPEDPRHVELRKEYVWRNGCVSEYSVGMAAGIRYAVAMLGVKIEGVNA